MEKILLFSRCNLVHLYGALSEHIDGDFEVIHLAYSKKEEKILNQNYNIYNVINFKNEINILYDGEKLDVSLCREIDNLIIKNSNNRFCLNSAIQSDRTFQHLTYEECLKLTQVYYKFWDSLLVKYNIKIIIHEANALLFTQMASMIANKYDAKYLTQIQVIGEKGFNWIFVEGDNGFPVELSSNLEDDNIHKFDEMRVNKFLQGFRSNQENHLSELFEKNNNLQRSYLSFLIDNIRLIVRSLKRNIFNANNKHPKPIDHVEKYLTINHRSFQEEFRNKWDFFFQLKYDSFNSADDYYYYPLHFEPEAVVLYWGDGIYKNQVKLIENIAAQLPPNCYLYVKDHPYTGEKRDYFDYNRIRAIPNVKLLDPKLPGRTIILKSRGVITINGTSGFEALLMNKQVFVFGNVFYDLCSRVIKIKNIRDFRELVYENYSKTFVDDIELYQFVYAYLKSVHEGYIAYFRDYVDLLHVNVKENTSIVAKGLINYLTNKKP